MQIRTGTARSGDLDIYYEDMGDPNDPAVLLIMGLGAQLLLWRTEFCEKLVDQGLRVIRYDNRDVGLSTKVTGRHTGAPLAPRMVRSFLGLRSQAVYTLEDVAGEGAARLCRRGWLARVWACAAKPCTRWRTWPTPPRRCSTT